MRSKRVFTHHGGYLTVCLIVHCHPRHCHVLPTRQGILILIVSKPGALPALEKVIIGLVDVYVALLKGEGGGGGYIRLDSFFVMRAGRLAKCRGARGITIKLTRSPLYHCACTLFCWYTLSDH